MRYFFLAALCLVISGAVYAQNIVGTGITGDALAPGGCSQYTALAARMDGSQNVSATRTLICGLASDGAIGGPTPLLDVLYVFATNSSGNALLNWISGSFNASVGASTCTFTANAGYACDAVTGYLTTNWTPSSNAVNYQLNNASIGLCDLTSSTTSVNYQDGVFDTHNLAINLRPGSTSQYVINANTGPPNPTIANTQGAWIAVRTGAAAEALYQNVSGTMTSINTSTQASTALPPGPLFIGAYDLGGTTPQGFSSDQIAWFFVGSGLTGTQINNIYGRLHTYLGAVGAPSGC